MASKRKSGSSQTNFNFRLQSESQKWETKGTKPLPSPVSVKEAILTMVIHVCRKILFINTNVKVGLYMAGLFTSLVFDATPFPRSYFSKSENVFNTYFVKLGWGWTLLLTLPFVLLTSFTYCCGKRRMILLHLTRMAVATGVWFAFTKGFALIEHNFGKCSAKGLTSKELCIAKGHYWHSLDISGHAFILIWSALVMVEEGRAIVGWETIKDLIRNEEHSRANSENDFSSPLRQISDQEFAVMKSSYLKFTPFVRVLFISMTLLTILWDLMIISTILYFHTMIEKLISGILAVSVWFVTYKYWYTIPKLLPNLPGEGSFKYNRSRDSRQSRDGIRGRGSIKSGKSSTSGQLPKFLGMPLYGLRNTEKETKEDVSKDETLASEVDEAPAKVVAGSGRSKANSTQWQPSARQSIATRSQTNSVQKSSGNKTI